MKTFFSVIFAAICILQILRAKNLDSSEKPVKLTDLPLELLLDIYENLDASTLANVARSHPYNGNAADIVFKNKFALQSFDINGDKLINANETFEFDELLYSLKTFGKHITKLKLDYRSFSDEQIQKINEHLVAYSADTLVEIEVKGCSDELLQALKGPFKNIHVVRLAGNITSNDIDLNEIFPAMRSLDLIFMNHYTPETIERHFPHLTELKVRNASCEAAFILNPQINSLEVVVIDWPQLRLISEALSNLERLTYIDADIDSRFHGDRIHFEKLKAFISKSYFGFFGFPRDLAGGPIIFGNLEEMESDKIGAKDWFVEIIQNPNLKSLRSGALDLEQYQEIFDKLTELNDLTIDYDFGIEDSVYSLVDLIKVNVALKSVAICAGFPTMINEEMPQNIADQLSEWQYNRTEDCLVFTREQ